MFIIRAKPGNMIPVGYIPDGGYVGDVVPEGFIECLGQRTEELAEYPDLATVMAPAGGVPDLRAKVVAVGGCRLIANGKTACPGCRVKVLVEDLEDNGLCAVCNGAEGVIW
jgi:hypothetical protein